MTGKRRICIPARLIIGCMMLSGFATGIRGLTRELNADRNGYQYQ